MIRKITIKEPIWSTKSVGLNVGGLGDENLVNVNIAYKDKYENLVFPGTFQMKVKDIAKYPVQLKWGYVRLHIVPIKVLQDHMLE